MKSKYVNHNFMEDWKNWLKVFLMFIVMLPLALSQAGPGVASYKKGLSYMKNNDCQTAIRYFDEAIQLEPINFVYYVRKGQCLMKLKRFDEAKQAFLKAAEVNKNFATGYALAAKIALKQKQTAEAIKYFNMAYTTEGDLSKKLKYKIFVIKLLIRDGREAEALNELEKLKADIPKAANDPRVLVAEGDIYAKMNRWDQAIAAYQRAVDRMKTTGDRLKVAPYYFKLGYAYYQSGDEARANQVWANLSGTKYEKRVRAVKAMSGARYYLAVAMGYFKASAYDNALEYAQQAINKAKPSEKVMAYRLTGFIYSKKGETQQAISYFAKAAQEEKDPKKRTAIYSAMIKMQFNNGDYSGALATANKILQNNPNNHKILFLKGQAEYQLGQYSAAVATLERAIAAAGTDKRVTSTYNFLLALAAKKAGDVNKARKALQNARFGLLKAAVMEEMKKLQQGQ